MKPKIIALCGPKGCGKTTLAKQLEKIGYARTRFADPIKLMIGKLLTYQGVSEIEAMRMVDGDLKETPTPFLDGQTPRHAMQILGTEWRNLISKNLWVNVWKHRIVDEFTVVDDLRFVHEARAVRDLGGKIIGIHRPGCEPGGHISEHEYLKVLPDITIINNREREFMFCQLNRCLESL